MHRRAAGIVIVCFSSAISFAATKAPWEWTTEERLAARLHTAMRPNTEKHTAATATEGSQAARGGWVEGGLDGRVNPELFLPHELFDGLLTTFMADEKLAAKQRGLYGPLIRQLGYDDREFWNTLQSLSSGYLPYRFGSIGSTPEKVAKWTAEKCSERHRALEAARSVYGAREFDRLLYVVVAPTAQHSGSASGGTPAQRIDELRRQEEGLCQ
jgi:hypothetical protein